MAAPTEHTVYAVKSREPPLSKKNAQESVETEIPPEKTCTYCGRSHEPGPMRCPAYGKICSRCGIQNHFAAVCKTKRAIHAVEESEDELIIDSLTVNTVSEDWWEEVQIGNRIVPTKLDTGAQANLISFEDLKQIEGRKLKITPCSTKLKSFTKHDVPLKGKCVVPLKCKGKDYKVRFLVVKGTVPMILGKNACEKMNLVKRIYADKKMALKDPEMRAVQRAPLV